jgi:DNA polymerase III epsilon subunit-like protein
MENFSKEVFVSVDVETAGPNPGSYSLLSIGACLVEDVSISFYVELQPVNLNATAEALSISGLSMEQLSEHGLAPEAAMERFAKWLNEVIQEGERPIFIGFNAPFDWMFVNDYFHRYWGENPFGHSALDIKAYAMGLDGITWEDTKMRFLAQKYNTGGSLTHNALQDAQNQAILFGNLFQQAKIRYVRPLEGGNNE